MFWKMHKLFLMENIQETGNSYAYREREGKRSFNISFYPLIFCVH